MSKRVATSTGDGVADLVRKVRELERRIARLEAARLSESSTD